MCVILQPPASELQLGLQPARETGAEPRGRGAFGEGGSGPLLARARSDARGHLARPARNALSAGTAGPHHNKENRDELSLISSWTVVA